MDFRGDPGAVQYGNFINYYQFNSAEERLKLLPANNLWKESKEQNDKPYIVLDVGCNSGDFTQIVYTFLRDQTNRNVFILGIDIDPILIKRANLANTFENVTYKCLDIMSASAIEDLQKYLNSHNQTYFNATFCLSITMWIHLNNGDNGLRTYLEKCSIISKLLVIEPQPWKCYQTAVKRMKKANSNFSNYQTLEWRKDVENQIKEYLENDLHLKKLHETIPTKWKRKISVYQDINKL